MCDTLIEAAAAINTMNTRSSKRKAGTQTRAQAKKKTKTTTTPKPKANAATKKKQAAKKKQPAKKKQTAAPPNRNQVSQKTRVPRKSKTKLVKNAHYELSYGEGIKISCRLEDFNGNHRSQVEVKSYNTKYPLEKTDVVDCTRLSIPKFEKGERVQCLLHNGKLSERKDKGKLFWWEGVIEEVKKQNTYEFGSFVVKPSDNSAAIVLPGSRIRNIVWKDAPLEKGMQAVGPAGPPVYLLPILAQRQKDREMKEKERKEAKERAAAEKKKAEKKKAEAEKKKAEKAEKKAREKAGKDVTDLMQTPDPNVIKFRGDGKGGYIHVTPDAAGTYQELQTPDVGHLVDTPVLAGDKYTRLAEQVGGILANPNNPIRKELYRTINFILSGRQLTTPPPAAARPAAAAAVARARARTPRAQKGKSNSPARKGKRTVKRLRVKEWSRKGGKNRWGAYVPSHVQYDTRVTEDRGSTQKKYLYFGMAHEENWLQHPEQWLAHAQAELSARTDDLTDAELMAWVHDERWEPYTTHPALIEIGDSFIVDV